METSYDVRIWKTEVYGGARTDEHTVRWAVAGHPWRQTFQDGGAGRRVPLGAGHGVPTGEAFGIESGRPVSMERAQRRVSWLSFAREYAVMKWPHLAAELATQYRACADERDAGAPTTTDRGRPPET